MPLGTTLPVGADEAFFRGPVTPYSNSYGPDLPENDTVRVSLLCPAPGVPRVTGRRREAAWS
ncbi:MAG: hypothetical protein OXI45_04790 [Acidobacteriota bacterium]|nr:hypothetical protein [Acidobacteriota bacterium]MDE2712025.1 hypothetical protein [Acidobacteriota bacterium]MXX86064.1 hypothetical protein [Acidobacteriota bacterium]MYE43934.1 hypothetical protein [Acidobacteriota bacterium]MYG74010.1 hypothetical protein [Acidobacteriota bacterium]